MADRVRVPRAAQRRAYARLVEVLYADGDALGVLEDIHPDEEVAAEAWSRAVTSLLRIAEGRSEEILDDRDAATRAAQETP